jgi:hypothetical protein
MRRAVCLLLLGFMVGCFNPDIHNGGLACGPGGSCPEGFVCSSGACYNRLPTAPTVDAAVGTGGSDGQTVEVGQSLIRIGDSCDLIMAGGVVTDRCVPGSVCVEGNVWHICMAVCSTSQDCTGGAVCERRRRAQTSAAEVSVCGLPTVTCNPIAGVVSGCPSGRYCYVDAPRTVCEITSGDGQQSPCLYSRDCLPGYLCAADGPGAGRCYPACTAGSTCPRMTTCSAMTGLGYCF